jgi:hypothetical protein
MSISKIVPVDDRVNIPRPYLHATTVSNSLWLRCLSGSFDD